jgi:hypothetical protein
VESIVGTITGLISIFTFITGFNSLAELRKQQRFATHQHRRSSRVLVRRLMVVVPVFAVSIFITASMGLAGSDTGGIVSLLLLSSLLVSLGSKWLGLSGDSSVRVFGVAACIGITLLGFLFGTISRGEEVFGLVAGIAIGAGTWLILAFTHRQQRISEGSQQTSREKENQHQQTGNTDMKKEILKVVSQQQGVVRVTDITLKTRISLADAKKTLDALTEQGFCDKERLASGATTYHFPDLE